MTEDQQKEAIKLLRAHHRDNSGVAWSLEAARPVAIHGDCIEYEFINPNGLSGFVLTPDRIPYAVNGPHSLARALSTARSWQVIYQERHRLAEIQRRKRKRRAA